jgi:hypothetical protein
MLRLPAEDFSAKLRRGWGEASSLKNLSLPLNKALRALKNGETAKVAGGEPLF